MVKFLQPSGLLKIAICAVAVMGFSFSESAYAVSAPIARVNSIGATITPAEGSYASLQEFTVTFPASDEVAFNETALRNGSVPVLKGLSSEGKEVTQSMAASGFSTDGNVMKFKCGYSELATIGEYTLTIPAACYTINGETGTELTFDYKVIASEAVQEYVVTPAAGEVSDLSSIELKFNNVLSITACPENGNNYAQLNFYNTKLHGGEWCEVVIDNEHIISANSLVLHAQEQLYSGQYRVVVPAGSYYLDGVENEAISIDYQLTVPEQDYAVILPTEGVVEALSNFTIEFPAATTVETAFERDACPVLYNLTTDKEEFSFTTATIDGNKMTLKLNQDIAVAGSYELRIPAACYLLDNVYGNALTFSYTIGTSDKTIEYSIAPEAGEDGTVSTISPIVVSFDNAAKVVANPDADTWSQYAIVEYQGKSKENWEEAVIEEQIQSNVLLYFLSESDTKDVTDRVYRLTIPAGTYLVDGVENPKIVQEFHYVVPSQDKFVALPAAGEVEGLQNFEIEFPAATAVAASFSREAYPVLYNVTDCHNEFSFMSATVDGNKMTLSMNAAVAYMGDYELRIPAGCYTLDGEAGEAITLAYKVVQSEKTFEYTITPADQSTIDNFSSVVVTFPNIRKIELDDTEVYPYFEYYDAQWFDWAVVDVNYETSANQLVITLPSWTSLESAQYNVVIPANFIIGDGITYNKEILSTFVLEQAVPEFATVIDPAEGTVSSLKSFNIVFKGIDKLSLNNYTPANKYYIEKEDGSKVYSSESYINEDAEGAPLYIEFAEITEAGKYTLVLPAGSYKVNDISGNELRFQYTIDNTDAVSSIFVNGVDSVDVYDLRGVRVLNNAKAADLRNLDSNVYIINGQKYLLRK